jgi:hypothetical protein
VSTPSNAATSASAVARSTALRTSGRSSTTVRTGPLPSTRTDIAQLASATGLSKPDSMAGSDPSGSTPSRRVDRVSAT